jgi:large subunit ribosomal protein L22
MATRQREKAERIAKERDKRPTAIAKYIRMPSDKVSVVLDLIRGKSYEQAVAILNNTYKSASPIILKVLNSAAANAENNLNMAKENLYVAQCWAMAGPTLKRMMPRAKGRADRILKRTAHIRVILDEREVVKPAKTGAKKETAVKKAPANPATPKPIPATKGEKPIAKEPNAKKPLGTKEVKPVKAAPKKQGGAK